MFDETMMAVRVIAEVVMSNIGNHSLSRVLSPVKEIFPLYNLISLTLLGNEDKHSPRWLF